MTMADYIKKGKVRRGFNTVLGEDYESGSSRMEEFKIRKAAQSPNTPEISKDKPMFIGIDVGLVCHVNLYVDGAIVKYEQIHYKKLKEKIQEYRAKYNIIAGAMDRYPYTSLAEEIRDETNGLIMPVVYNGIKDAEPKKDVDGKVIYYNINRTSALDKVMDGIEQERLLLYGYGDMLDTIITHYRDMIRDDEAGKAPEWQKLNGNDHFFHSSAYSIVAEKIYYVEGLGEVEKEQRDYVLFAASSDKHESKNKNSMDNINLIGYSSSRENRLY